MARPRSSFHFGRSKPVVPRTTCFSASRPSLPNRIHRSPATPRAKIAGSFLYFAHFKGLNSSENENSENHNRVVFFRALFQNLRENCTDSCETRYFKDFSIGNEVKLAKFYHITLFLALMQRRALLMKRARKIPQRIEISGLHEVQTF